MNLGLGFPDPIAKISYRLKQHDEGGSRKPPLFLLFIVFAPLLLQTIRLQLVEGHYYRILSDQNRIRTKILHAPRGTIYDRTGKALVINIPGFREERQDCKNEANCIRVLTRDEVLDRKAKGEKMENLEIDSLRQYVKPETFAHILGFISEISKEELSDPAFKSKGYLLGDRIGRGGIEEQYEEILRGTVGKELVETDAKGSELRILGKIDPVAGQDITLSIDAKLQEVAFEEMKGKTGVVIVSDPNTGDILTLVSTPSFDPNLFTLGDNYQKDSKKTGVSLQQPEKEYKTAQEVLSDNTNKPIFNRAISGTYPPGSTFKIVTAAASLEKGAIDKDTKIEDVGILRIGVFSFPNWYFTQYGKTEGSLDIVGAIRRSNDIFFYKAAEMTGLEELKAMGEKFGLAKKLGIDLPNEASGLFPSDSWKKETIGEGWYLGDTYHLGIGQGYLLVTPLQMNSWTAVIASGGKLYQPRLIKKSPINQSSKNPINKNFLKPETVELIRAGMRQACDTGGTGWPLFKFEIRNSKYEIDNKNFFPAVVATESGKVHIPVACKTGTAEFGDPKNRTHAWFTAYAPIANPQLVVTVLVEGGGEGSNVAAPIAKKIFEEWFTR